MRKTLHDRYGEPRDVLRVEAADDEAPGEGEVIVRMEAAPLHIADLRTIQGRAPFTDAPLPRTPGFEGIGRIARVGSGVSGVAPGDRVFPALGCGTFREEVRCAAHDCLPAPQGDALQLSLLTVNAPTAFVMLNDLVPLAKGDWIAQNAANSSCGRFVVSLARRRGVRTLNVVRRAELVAEIEALGGDAVLVDGPDLAARAREATGNASIRLALDAVGGLATQRLGEMLAPGGLIASYGSMSGEPCALDLYLMFGQDIRLIGVSFVRELRRHRDAAAVRAVYAELAALLVCGELRARIAAVYPLTEVVRACEHAARTGAERDGKVVLQMT
jgi:NADPH:quinone reductase-like Zn-dependent oxidoreductase